MKLGAGHHLHYEKSHIFSAYLFVDFKITIMGTGGSTVTNFADLVVELMCPSGWDEEKIW